MTHAEGEGKPEEVVVECEMEASPEKLWRALTEEELASEWLGARPAREDGEAPDGPTYRVIEAEPYSRVRLNWHDPDCPDAPSAIIIELERMSSGNTWFRLVHGETVARARHITAANTSMPPLAQAA